MAKGSDQVVSFYVSNKSCGTNKEKTTQPLPKIAFFQLNSKQLIKQFCESRRISKQLQSL